MIERTADLNEANKQLKAEIEKRVKTEESLQKTRNMLQTVVDGITDPLVMLKHFGPGNPDLVL